MVELTSLKHGERFSKVLGRVQHVLPPQVCPPLTTVIVVRQEAPIEFVLLEKRIVTMYENRTTTKSTTIFPQNLVKGELLWISGKRRKDVKHDAPSQRWLHITRVSWRPPIARSSRVPDKLRTKKVYPVPAYDGAAMRHVLEEASLLHHILEYLPPGKFAKSQRLLSY